MLTYNSLAMVVVGLEEYLIDLFSSKSTVTSYELRSTSGTPKVSRYIISPERQIVSMNQISKQ